jgi:hypothetical protein
MFVKVIDPDGQELVLSHGSIYLSSNFDMQKEELLRRLKDTKVVWALSRQATTGRCGKVMQTHAVQVPIKNTESESYKTLSNYYGIFIPAS